MGMSNRTAEIKENRLFWAEQRRREKSTNWQEWPIYRGGNPQSVDIEQPIATALLDTLAGSTIVKCEGDYATVRLVLDDDRVIEFQGHWTNTSEDALGVSWDTT
jgi:hypothetical protein